MPFIRGRYHINPIAGAALEAAREADEALSAADRSAGGGRLASTAPGANSRASDNGAQGPIHRVEIEVADVVPSHSGRATRGFVARVHRASVATGNPTESSANHDFFSGPASGGSQSGGAQGGQASNQAPETHVFADHQDLTNFLNGEFAKDSGQ